MPEKLQKGISLRMIQTMLIIISVITSGIMIFATHGMEAEGLTELRKELGIVHGSQASDPATLFEKTDAAIYESKKHGKHTYTFYTK